VPHFPSYLKIAEPLAFSASVMICIWIFYGHMAAPVILLTLWMLASWRVRGETAASLGFSIPSALRCFMRWRFIFLLLAVLVMTAGGRSLASMTTLWHAFRYFIWCVAQQTVYQSMVFRPLRSAIGGTITAAILSGALFAIVHLPNPVLVPATFAWGVCASLLFCACPSVIALGGVQFLLSAAGVLLIPAALHHGFRIGPGY